jgi:hypothetical protein
VPGVSPPTAQLVFLSLAATFSSTLPLPQRRSFLTDVTKPADGIAGGLLGRPAGRRGARSSPPNRFPIHRKLRGSLITDTIGARSETCRPLGPGVRGPVPGPATGGERTLYLVGDRDPLSPRSLHGLLSNMLSKSLVGGELVVSEELVSGGIRRKQRIQLCVRVKLIRHVRCE